MPASIAHLDPFDADGRLRVVVEAPKGATVKLAYDEEIHAFSVSRTLPLGLAYPYDWGFIPGTRAEDGDPLDAIVLHGTSTYPGVVLPCHVLGMVELSEQGGNGKRRHNNRVIASPAWKSARGTAQRPHPVPDPMREQIEEFFLNTTFFTAKNARIEGWKSAGIAEAFIRRLAGSAR